MCTSCRSRRRSRASPAFSGCRSSLPYLETVSFRFTDESVPGPLRDVQAGRHIVCRTVVTSHRGRGSPGEVIMQDAPEPLVAGEAGVFQRLIETNDRPLVHLL